MVAARVAIRPWRYLFSALERSAGGTITRITVQQRYRAILVAASSFPLRLRLPTMPLNAASISTC